LNGDVHFRNKILELLGESASIGYSPVIGLPKNENSNVQNHFGCPSSLSSTQTVSNTSQQITVANYLISNSSRAPSAVSLPSTLSRNNSGGAQQLKETSRSSTISRSDSASSQLLSVVQDKCTISQRPSTGAAQTLIELHYQLPNQAVTNSISYAHVPITRSNSGSLSQHASVPSTPSKPTTIRESLGQVTSPFPPFPEISPRNSLMRSSTGTVIDPISRPPSIEHDQDISENNLDRLNSIIISEDDDDDTVEGRTIRAEQDVVEAIVDIPQKKAK
jgi:hypothetical protein